MKKRKISGSNRSDLGLRRRYTPARVKKTRRRLWVGFWAYTQKQDIRLELDSEATPTLEATGRRITGLTVTRPGLRACRDGPSLINSG
ncbi:hypothetical protein ACFL2Q_08615 [Thermodesulfobacteriota bacterium]